MLKGGGKRLVGCKVVSKFEVDVELEVVVEGVEGLVDFELSVG